MKTGAGEDPFSDDEADDPPEGRSTEPGDDRSTADGPETRGEEPARIPYKLRRDGVQDGRRRVPLFLQEETKRGERDARRELEDRFGEDVALTDLREALVLAGLSDLDEVEARLEDWGYGLSFDD